MTRIATEKPRFCVNMHDTLIVGRDNGSSRECSECRRERVRRDRNRWYNYRMNNVISKLKKQTVNRLSYRRKNGYRV